VTVRTALLVVVLILSACTATTPPPMRGTELLPEPPIELTALEERKPVQGLDGQDICADLLFRKTSLERFADRNGTPFTLGIIEISDNGLIADDVQKEMVLARLREVALGGKDRTGDVRDAPGVILITFVHGWHHRSKVCDNNLACFRRVLEALSAAEGKSGRPVFGIYVGWRGDTYEQAKALSFYNRKATAHHIGREAGREVLLELDDLYRELNQRIATSDRLHPVTMVTAGHSFGGALVYSAVEGALVRQLRNPDPDAKGSVMVVGRPADQNNVRPIRRGIGDLVVLVNPAFEASRYQIFADDETTPGSYAENQLPVLLTVASEGDDAVKIAFPLGRSLYFSVLPWRWFRHGISDIIGAGHYDPQTTHDLVMADDAKNVIRPSPATPPEPEKADAATIERCKLDVKAGDLATCECEYKVPDLLALTHEDVGSLTLAEGAVRTAPNENVSLRPRNPARDSRSPYIVARVSPSIISKHSDIYTPRFITFLTAYIREFLEQSKQKAAAP
jgi:hypothetical protein